MKKINDAIRFCVELATIYLIVKCGMRFTGFYSFFGAIIIPILVILYWGRYMAPKSLHRLPEFGRIISEVVIFGGTGSLMYVQNFKTVTVIYLLIVLCNTILDHVL